MCTSPSAASYILYDARIPQDDPRITASTAWNDASLTEP